MKRPKPPAPPELGIYVHWPFCTSKCPYCDFNSHVAGEVDHATWRAALLAEIDRHAIELGRRRVVSIFFGGGTPSLMEPATVGAVIDRIAERFDLDPMAENSLEANPGSVEVDRFAGFAAAGVNRVSIGVQALNDVDLRGLGRVHSAAEARRAIEIAVRRFRRTSIDLIYARQHQTIENWTEELNEAVRLGTGHLSLYQLTIEPGTVFARRRATGGLRGLPDEDLSADLFEVTQEICSNAGFTAYEVSNHAKPGQESRHNGLYWSCADWIGIGPGAHGRLTIASRRMGTETALDPTVWLKAALNGCGESRREDLSATEQMDEYLLMGLRRSSGVSLLRLKGLVGRPIPASVWDELTSLKLVEVQAGRLRATEKGRPVLNAIIGRLATNLDRLLAQGPSSLGMEESARQR